MESKYLLINENFTYHEKAGKIPLGWAPRKGKECFKIFGSTSLSSLIEDKEGGWLYMKVEDFNNTNNSFSILEAQIRVAEQSKSNGKVPLNSIVVSKRGEAIRKNRVRIIAKPTFLDPNLMALSIKEGINNIFFKYLLEQMSLQRFLEDSAVPQLNNKDFYPRLFVVPDDENEQAAIATILSKVDEAIAATEKSIKAAEKLKKGMMQNLLTGRLKPDGTWREEDEFYIIEKFGKVPVGWEVRGVGDKSHCNINPNYKFTKGEEYDFIPMEAINDNFRGVNYLETKIIEGGGFTRFKKGDILFAKITPCTENGKVALVEEMNSEIGFASTEFIVFQPKENVDNLFFYYLLSSSTVHHLAVSLMEGTTGRQRVPWKVFKKRIQAAFPKDLQEQSFIASKIKSIEQSNQSKQAKIITLQRLKKSLMQNLLTGKVRLSTEIIDKILKDERIEVIEDVAV